MTKLIIRALRLPFLSASILPFVFGAAIQKESFNFLGFLFGLLTVAATHLSANLINDYADSQSGADWQDRRFYQFFGGSKLIQEGLLSEGAYLKLAIFFASLSFVSVILLATLIKSFSAVLFYIIIILLGWSYSAGPFRFSYRGLGELVIFILFGPALVMGGYFIQTGIFLDLKSFLLSLPFGFFTTAILFANEIPDFREDKRVKKITWVNFFGVEKSFLLYILLVILGFSAIVLGVICKFLGLIALASFLLIFPSVKAAHILRNFPRDKLKLVESSRLTIALQTLVSIILILDRLI